VNQPHQPASADVPAVHRIAACRTGLATQARHRARYRSCCGHGATVMRHKAARPNS